MMFGWFGTVIRESEAAPTTSRWDRSFRWGMTWFIFSEVMFFAAFFGALSTARTFVHCPGWAASGKHLFTNLIICGVAMSRLGPATVPASSAAAFKAMEALGIAGRSTPHSC